MQTNEYREFVGQFRTCAQTWAWPLLISLGLHTVFFWPAKLVESEPVSASMPALQAHLQPSAPIVTSSAQPSSNTTVRRTEMTPPKQFVPTSAVKNTPVPVAELQPTVALTPNVTVTALTVDAGGVRAYRISLARMLGQGTWRTQLAADVQGRLEVGVAVNANGMVESVSLVRSSGNPLLDQQILAAVGTAARAALIPVSLQGGAFVVLLPVEVETTPISVVGR